MSHYFINDNNLKSDEKIIKINFNNKLYSFFTDSGVFAKNSFDYGSRLLLSSILNIDIKGNVLDLGCGYGIIGILLKCNKKLLEVDMIDINERAIALSKKNAKLNNVDLDIFLSNIYDNVNKKYDYIITNPPIRAGKEIIRKFLFEACYYLNDEGQLWFVIHKDHGAKSMIEELKKIYSLEIKEKSKGFYIVVGKKLKN